MTYSFLPTCQFLYHSDTDNMQADGERDLEPGNKVRVCSSNPWMGLIETAPAPGVFSNSSSETSISSNASSNSSNSISNTGPLTRQDILAAQERVLIHSNRKSISPLYDDFLNWDTEDYRPASLTTDKYPHPSCLPVIRSKTTEQNINAVLISNEKHGDKYEYLYGPLTPEIKPQVLPAVENIPVPHNTPVIDSKQPDIAELLAASQEHFLCVKRDDTPHLNTGKIMLDHNNVKNTSPPIEEPP